MDGWLDAIRYPICAGTRPEIARGGEKRVKISLCEKRACFLNVRTLDELADANNLVIYGYIYALTLHKSRQRKTEHCSMSLK